MLQATKEKAIIKAPALKPGNRVGLIAPSSRPQTPAVVARCMQIVRDLGLEPVLGEHVMDVHGFMAGTDNDRTNDLLRFIDDDSVKGIFVISGGYGALHLVPKLDYVAIAAEPKVYVGCDDATVLINAIHARTGLVTFHAPNIDQIKSRFTFELLKHALMSTQPLAEINASARQPDEVYGSDFFCSVGGTVEGKTVGGNLTALCSLLGTPFEPYFRERILFLEDVNEDNGILDRWFTSLYLAGHLQLITGVACGSFENCNTRGSLNMLSVMETFSDRLQYLRKPGCFGVPFGQTRDTAVMPLGVRARLHCDSGRLEFLEPALV